MIQFTFNGIFKTTAKGLPNTDNLPANSLLSSTFYTMSLVFQIIIAIVFVFYFGMAVFRSVKKIKNRKFIMTSPKEKDQNQNQQQTPENGQKAETADQLIYKFDEQDHQKQNGDKQVQQEKNQEQQEDQVEQEDQQQDEKSIIFLQIDSSLLTFTPLLILPVILNNSFTMDVIGIICSSVSIILFAIFNVKGLGSKFKILSSLYLIPAVGAIVPFFLNDHDMST